jgi:hypothetical protein
MGLLDSILGNMMGAGGSAMQGRSGSTSPIVKALMMLLAAKAYQHHRSGQTGWLPGRRAQWACWAARGQPWRDAW